MGSVRRAPGGPAAWVVRVVLSLSPGGACGHFLSDRARMTHA